MGYLTGPVAVVLSLFAKIPVNDGGVQAIEYHYEMEDVQTCGR